MLRAQQDQVLMPAWSPNAVRAAHDSQDEQRDAQK